MPLSSDLISYVNAFYELARSDESGYIYYDIYPASVFLSL